MPVPWLNRLAIHIKKISDEEARDHPLITIKTAAKWQNELDFEFIKDMTPPALIIIQFPCMIEICKDNLDVAFQTDTIEGWIVDEDYPTAMVTTTSTYSKLLGRHVPVLMSVSPAFVVTVHLHVFVSVFLIA